MMKTRRKSLTAMAGGMFLIMLAPAALAQADYQTYLNRRYEYAVANPASLLIPLGEAPNGDGQSFISKDKAATLKVWGEINALDKSLAQRYTELIRPTLERQVTYRVLNERERWFVISGMQGSTVFYQKTMVTREQHMLTLVLTTPSSQAALWKFHTPIIAKSFRRDV